MYTPPRYDRASDIYISPWSYQSLGVELYGITAFPSNAIYAVAGRVIFVPFWTAEPITVTKLWWHNGSAVAGNVDVGIYNEDQTLIVSAGTTAAAGTDTTQSVDITDTNIGRGTYYMAICCSDATTQRVYAYTFGDGGVAQAFGLLQQASVTLPLSTGASPATFAIFATAFLPFFGLQCYRAIGP